MQTPPPAKSKRSTMACTHCRERKVKCENNNDGLTCERCKKNKKDCRYEPVNPVTDPQPSTSPPCDPPITGDKPIMTVYQEPTSSASPPALVEQWPEYDPSLRTPFPVDAQGRPLHLPYDSMSPSLTYQPPQAYPSAQYSVAPWQPPFMPPPTQPQFPYGQGENSYASGHGYWTGPRGSNVLNDKSGDRTEDRSGEPSG